MKPHKHAEVIKAWADGYAIQYRDEITDQIWIDVVFPQPNWFGSFEYRIKPKPDVSQNYFATRAGTTRFSGDTPDMPVNLKLTWDGETGKLKKAEVL